jgi:hypothetical protein
MLPKKTMMIKITISILIIITSVEISGDRNMIKKGTEKTLKYYELIIGIDCVWNVKTKAIPV